MKEVDEEEKEIKALDEKDIALLKSYGQGQYTKALKVRIRIDDQLLYECDAHFN